MSSEGDVDDAILDLANSLLRMIKEKQVTNKQVVLIPDVPELLVRLFELITSEVIRDDQRTNGARTLQTIFDTLAEIMNVPLNHITGVGLITLDRRQLFDALQVFNDLMKCYMVEDEQTTREKERDEEMLLTLSQLETPRLHQTNRFENSVGQSDGTSTPRLANQQLHGTLRTKTATGRTAPNELYNPSKPFYVNQERTTTTRPVTGSSHTDTVDRNHHDIPRSSAKGSIPAQTKSSSTVNGGSRYQFSLSSRRSPFVAGKPRVISFSSKSQGRHPSVSSKKSDKSSRPQSRNTIRTNNSPQTVVKSNRPYFQGSIRRDRPRNIAHRQPSTSTSSRSCNKARNGSAGSHAGDVFTTGRSRKASVVSTKVKRHAVTSPTDGVRTHRQVRRGELSPQTVSLCSSLKILEEFDYLKRRYKEIQTEIEQHMSKVRDLQAEEVRIEYVLNHVQQQLSFTKSKKHSKIEREIGLPV